MLRSVEGSQAGTCTRVPGCAHALGSLVFTVVGRGRARARRGGKGSGGLVVTYTFWGPITCADSVVQTESRRTVSYYKFSKRWVGRSSQHEQKGASRANGEPRPSPPPQQRTSVQYSRIDERVKCALNRRAVLRTARLAIAVPGPVTFGFCSVQSEDRVRVSRVR